MYGKTTTRSSVRNNFSQLSLMAGIGMGIEPAYLPVGTDVSAKYRGAFCEAKVKCLKKTSPM